MQQLISHEGIIENISGNKIFVSILSVSACSSCHSKSMCSVSEMKEKQVEVRIHPDHSYRIGQKVKVSLTKRNGNLAVIYGYLIPFLLLIATLLISVEYFNELISGLLAIAVLPPYYFLLYTFRQRLANKFEFIIS